MTPDAIIVLSAGIIHYEDAEGRQQWRSTTFDEADAFGTLGGRDRVEAAALLAQKYPQAFLATTSHQMSGELPTLASVYADELRVLGVPPERIIEAENSTTTESAVQEAVRLAKEKGWNTIAFVSSGYHIPRVTAFYKRAQNTIAADFMSADSLLAEHNPAFAKYFEQIQKTPAYQKRLAAEQEGLEAITHGTYQSAPAEDKLERPV